jgi:branched-chain amino acid transport system ATP-binding protein
MTNTNPSSSLLVASELIAGYLPGVNILNGCNFYANKGELVGIIGPNGAGKSTLLKSLFGLVKIGSGTVSLLGEDICGLINWYKKVLVLFHNQTTSFPL